MGAQIASQSAPGSTHCRLVREGMYFLSTHPTLKSSGMGPRVAPQILRRWRVQGCWVMAQNSGWFWFEVLHVLPYTY